MTADDIFEVKKIFHSSLQILRIDLLWAFASWKAWHSKSSTTGPAVNSRKTNFTIEKPRIAHLRTWQRSGNSLGGKWERLTHPDFQSICFRFQQHLLPIFWNKSLFFERRTPHTWRKDFCMLSWLIWQRMTKSRRTKKRNFCGEKRIVLFFFFLSFCQKVEDEDGKVKFSFGIFIVYLFSLNLRQLFIIFSRENHDGCIIKTVSLTEIVEK